MGQVPLQEHRARASGAWMTGEKLKLNEYDLCWENKQGFSDAIMLTFSLLTFNMDPFLLVGSPVIIND